MSELFENLFIFEMANNHQGNLNHGLNIIKEMGDLAKKQDIKAAVKFQYRDLDTFIHKDFTDREDLKHIPRFLSTRLSDEEFFTLSKFTKQNGMLSIVTPFDEVSVDKCIRNGIDIIKIGSCSAKDWPLLEKIANSGKPVIASTGGLDIHEIDNLVSFFEHRNVDFAVMYCVALYPSLNDSIHMNFLEKLIKRYPKRIIGYSGHETPDNLDIVKTAVCKGAKIFERHVGLETDEIKLNKYSMNPSQVDEWVKAVLTIKKICGQVNKKIDETERESLLSLKRGVYAKRLISKGEKINREDVYFAMPCQSEQTSSEEMGKMRSLLIAERDYQPHEALFIHDTSKDPIANTRKIIHEYKGMINEAGIRLGKNFELELSHHYGSERFREVGILIVNIMNREYCKKIICLLPNQINPNHLHKKKEETFQVLWGNLKVNLDGKMYNLFPGDLLLIERDKMHNFSSDTGAIFEEISTTHYGRDSYYEDIEISSLDPIERKTKIDNW